MHNTNINNDTLHVTPDEIVIAAPTGTHGVSLKKHDIADMPHNPVHDHIYMIPPTSSVNDAEPNSVIINELPRLTENSDALAGTKTCDSAFPGDLLTQIEKTAQRVEPEEDNKLKDLYCETKTGKYISKNERGVFLIKDTAKMKRLLKARGHRSDKDKSDNLSEIDQILLDIEEKKDVDYVGELAGRDSGFYEENGVRLLITHSPIVIQPEKGPCPTLLKFINGMFDDNQMIYLIGWLSVAYKALLKRERMPGQAFAIAGPADCGKSLLQNIITLILGGRSAKPYQFMTGSSPFNSDLFKAEHLMIEDESASTDIRARRNMAALIKAFTVNEDQRCHAKGRDAVMLRPFWRLTITMNDEPENLMVLPPIDESLKDKLILLKAKRSKMPMPTETIGQRKCFWETLTSELPAFCYFLATCTLPADMKSSRFGVTHYHNEELLSELNISAPEIRLLEIIDAAILGKIWHGTASELQARLTRKDLLFANEAQNILRWNGAAGTYLGRLKKLYPKRFEAHRTNSTRTWTIHKER